MNGTLKKASRIVNCFFFLAVVVAYLDIPRNYNRKYRKLIGGPFTHKAIETYSAIDVTENDYARDLFLKPIRTNRPPLIHHISADRDYGSLSECIRDETNLPPFLIAQLLEFGAIHYAIRNGTVPKRTTEDIYCPKSSYVRVHMNPHRYPQAWDYVWKDHILFTDSLLDSANRNELMASSPKLLEFLQSYVIVNKPSGLPCVSTVDNLKENVNFQIDKVESCQLSITSRIDGCTSGLVVFARTSQASAYFHKCLRDNEIDKFYSAITYRRVEAGVHRHLYPKRGSITGKHYNSKPTLLKPFPPNHNIQESSENGINNSWILAELEVISCLPIKVDNIEPKGSAMHDQLFESRVKLITGRTHQIRLQFAAMNAPLVNDTRYEPVAGLYHNDEGGCGDGSALFGKEPNRIGLQCSQLSIPLPLEVQQQMQAIGTTEAIRINDYCVVENGYLVCRAPPMAL